MLGHSPKTILHPTPAWARYPQLQWQSIRHLNLLRELFVPSPSPKSFRHESLLNACQLKHLPSPAGIKLRLKAGPDLPSERLTLSEAQACLKPLHHLNLSAHRHVATDKKIFLRKNKTYEILPLTLPTDFVPKILKNTPQRHVYDSSDGFPDEGHHAGRGRQVHLTVYLPPKHLARSLKMAYTCLLQGCRVEFHLHRKSDDLRVQNTVDWVLKHSLHLRPDVILMAMPEGTEMLALPATIKSPMGEELVWALELPEALSKAGCRTPKHIKNRAQWGQVRTTNQASDGE